MTEIKNILDRDNTIRLASERERVRNRPGMYVGQNTPHTRDAWVIDGNAFKKLPTDYIPAYVKLFDEVLGNSIDEALRTNFKVGNKIDVVVDKDGILVEDNGRGIPFDPDPQTGLRQTLLAATHLGAGGNFDHHDVESIGTNGVGLTCVNFLSKQLHIISKRGGKYHALIFTNGGDNIETDKVGKTKEPDGTMLRYIPDAEWFGMSIMCDAIHKSMIRKRVMDAAFCYPKIKFTFNGENISTSNISSYASKYGSTDIISHESDGFRIAIMPATDGHEAVTFVNALDCYDGGVFVDHIVKKISDGVREEILRKHKLDVKPSDIKAGLFIISSIRMTSAKFDSQTKSRCINGPDNPEVQAAINSMDEKFLKKIVRCDTIITPIIAAYQAREAAKLARQINDKNKKNKSKQVAKLTECNSPHRDRCTLFITEGDSAKAAAVDVRNPEYHAFLPLRGKVLNVWHLDLKNPKDLKKFMDNKEVVSMMSAIGLEVGKEPFNLQYGRIAILADQDVDGDCISAQLIALFYKYWPQLFRAGKIVRVLSPLYIVTMNKGMVHRFYSDKEYAEWKNGITDDSIKSISYNKGLGSLSLMEYDLMINKPKFLQINEGEEAFEHLEIAFADNADNRKSWMAVL